MQISAGDQAAGVLNVQDESKFQAGDGLRGRRQVVVTEMKDR